MPTTIAVDASAVGPESGGVHTYAANLLPSLSRQVDLLVLARHKDEIDWPGRVRRVAPEVPRRLVWEQTTLPHIVASENDRPEVLHSLHYSMPWRRPPGVKRVVTFHDLAWMRRPEEQHGGPWHPRLKRLYFPPMIRHSARYADAIICASRRVADEARERLPLRAPIFVIPLGVDCSTFAPEPMHDDGVMFRSFAEKHEVREPFVLYVGALEPRKNIPNLLSAFELATRSTDTQLVLVGKPWPDFVLPKHPNVVRTGFVDPAILPVLYRRAAAFAYVSFEEGFGLPVLEALASGTPVITSEDTVMADLCGPSALCVEPKSIESIAAAIDDALAGRHPDVSVGVKTANRYTWEACADAHAKVYEAVGIGIG